MPTSPGGIVAFGACPHMPLLHLQNKAISSFPHLLPALHIKVGAHLSAH